MSEIAPSPKSFVPSKTLKIHRCAESPVLDGAGKSPCWAKIPPLDDFDYPWQDDKPEKTEFRACFDDENLYLFYDVVDHTPVFLEKQREKLDLVFEDRVEIFFSVDEKMSTYYCFEASPTGLCLDYIAHYHRNFDYLWKAKGVVVKGRKRDDGYSVEMLFPLAELREYGVLKPDGRIFAGLYRADFMRADDGSDKIVDRWISWVDPKLETIDFHVPETLGVLVLE